jgi:hypothetical protein
MVILTSSNLSLSNIALTFGGTGQINLGNYYSDLSNNYTIQYSVGNKLIPISGNPIKFSNFLNTQSLPITITDKSYLSTTPFLLSTTNKISPTNGWLSGDSVTNNVDGRSVGSRTQYGSSRLVVQINSVLRVRPGHSITISSRCGQSSTFTNYYFQYWLNYGSGYQLISTNGPKTISNGSSAIITLTININAIQQNGALVVTLASGQMTQLNDTYLTANLTTLRINCDVYPLQIWN